MEASASVSADVTLPIPEQQIAFEQASLFTGTEYEKTLGADLEGDWHSSLWETPREVCQFMASLIRADERVIIEPACGTGNIVIELPLSATVYVYEILTERYEALLARLKDEAIEPVCLRKDFISAVNYLAKSFKADLIIGNPPFHLGIEFLAAAAKVMKRTGRILFLLPSEFFQAKGRSKGLQATGLKITNRWDISGRVAFEKNGKGERNRQCYDTVFELRLVGDATTHVVIL